MSGVRRTLVAALVLAGAVAVVLGAPVIVQPAEATTVNVTGTGGFSSNSGTTLVYAGASKSTTVEFDDLFPNADTVTLNASTGKISVTSTADTTAKVTEANLTDATWTNLTAMDVTAGDLTVDEQGNPVFVVSGDTSHVAVKDTISTDDDNADFTYGGPSGTTSLKLTHAPASTQLAAVDVNSNRVLDVATSDAAGTISYTLPNSDHDTDLKTNKGGPIVDNSSPSPTGGPLRFENQTLSIDISDPDFPDDNVTVEFYVDNTKVGETTTKSNGTVSQSVTRLGEGSHDWYAVATDAYGQTAQSKTFTFTVDHYDTTFSDANPTGDINFSPNELNVTLTDRDFATNADGDELDVTISQNGTQLKTTTLTSNGTVRAAVSDPPGGQHTWTVSVTDQYGQTFSQQYKYRTPALLQIFNETRPSQRITNKGTVTVTFFTNNQVIERTTTDGNISLDGLPITGGIKAQADVKTYNQRVTVIDSLYQQQEIYLLSKNITSADVIFGLNDESGQFPPDESKLVIKKPLTKDFNGDGTSETRRQVISSDEFSSVDEVPTTLQTNIRYRLEVHNGNNIRDVGHYTVTGNAREVIKIGRVNFSTAGDKGYAVDATTTRFNNHRYVRINYNDPGNKTSQFKYRLKTRNGTYIDNRTVNERLGTYSVAINVTRAAKQTFSNDTTFVVNYTITRNGQTITGTEYTGDVTSVPVNIDSRWLSIIALVGIIALTGLVVIVDSGLGAITAVASGTLFTMLGFISLPGPALALAGAAAILFNIGGRR